jgi:putative phosphoesterase
MKIGILSDTHDQVIRTRSAVSLLVERGAEVLIHCGDLTIPEVVYECAQRPAYFVFGNCDYDLQSLERAIREIGGNCLNRGGFITLSHRQIAVTHGDSHSELRRLARVQPHYLCSGHTHRCSDEQRGPTRWINPGALYRASIWTVAILDIVSNHVSVLPISDTLMRE